MDVEKEAPEYDTPFLPIIPAPVTVNVYTLPETAGKMQVIIGLPAVLVKVANEGLGKLVGTVVSVVVTVTVVVVNAHAAVPPAEVAPELHSVQLLSFLAVAAVKLYPAEQLVGPVQFAHAFVPPMEY